MPVARPTPAPFPNPSRDHVLSRQYRKWQTNTFTPLLSPNFAPPQSHQPLLSYQKLQKDILKVNHRCRVGRDRLSLLLLYYNAGSYYSSIKVSYPSFQPHISLYAKNRYNQLYHHINVSTYISAPFHFIPSYLSHHVISIRDLSTTDRPSITFHAIRASRLWAAWVVYLHTCEGVWVVWIVVDGWTDGGVAALWVVGIASWEWEGGW